MRGLTLSLLILTSTAVAAERNLDRWFDNELVPYVQSQLLEHPRFKGETVMFVALDNNAPATVANELALSLRERLLDAALNTAGVSIGWRQGGSPTSDASRPVDCINDNVHYYIGIDIAPQIDGSVRVGVRALDLEDRNWVTGFGRQWRGGLSTVQRNALRNTRRDMTFQGARDVPFNAAESDLLAQHLSHELACALYRQTSGGYVVDASLGVSPEFEATAQLAANSLARHSALEFADDRKLANAELSVQVHRIDGPLYQYWLTVTPLEPDEELPTLSASAYVTMPGIRVAATPSVPNPSAPKPSASPALDIPPANTTIGPLRVVRSNDPAACRKRRSAWQASYSRYQDDCTLLAADLHSDAILFVLQDQASLGLVRLADSACRNRASPHVVTRGQRLRWPLPGEAVQGAATFESRVWQREPHVDTYYAFAVTDAGAARQFANLLDGLPTRCGDAVQPGLKNNALHRWLDEFAMLAARHSQHVDWRAIQVKDVL